VTCSWTRPSHAFSFANRLPAAVSRLHGPAVVDLS
jgi:hypothetical protein